MQVLQSRHHVHPEDLVVPRDETSKISSTCAPRWRDDLDSGLREPPVLLKKGEHVPSRAIFEDQPQIISRLVPIMESKGMWRIQAMHNLNFVHHTIHERFVDSFDRDILDGFFLTAFKYLTFQRPKKDRFSKSRLAPNCDLSNLRVATLPNFIVEVVLIH
jgi:hypothetical protein